MVEFSAYTMVLFGLITSVWFFWLFINGHYKSIFPALICLSESLLEISWLTDKNFIPIRTIAWQFNSVGFFMLLIIYSYKHLVNKS